jgi:hypothetical protein
VRLADAVEDKKTKAEELREIVQGQIAAGFTDAARMTLDRHFLPLLPLEEQDSYVLEKIVLLLAQAEDYANGYAISQKLEGDYRISGLLTVAACQAMAKGPDAPMAFAEKERDPPVRSAVYLGTALGLLKAKGIEVRNHYGLTLIEEE